jgi:hypothetical protein
MLNSRLYHAKEAADPVRLFAVSLAELLESPHQLGRSLTAILDLLFDLIEEGVEFAVDFEQGMILCYGCHYNLLQIALYVLKTRGRSQPSVRATELGFARPRDLALAEGHEMPCKTFGLALGN